MFPIKKEKIMKLNINCSVKARLTEEGMEVVRNEIARYGKHYHKVTDGNLFETQLWILMQVFGPFIFHGCKNHIVDNVIEIIEE